MSTPASLDGHLRHDRTAGMDPSAILPPAAIEAAHRLADAAPPVSAETKARIAKLLRRSTTGL